MNELTFLSRVKAAQELWKFVLPDIPFPPNETWVRWLAASYDLEFEKAVLQIPKRYKNQKPSDDEVYRCVSAVLAEYRRVRQRTAKIEQQKLVPTQSRVVSQKGGSMTEMNDQIAPIADPTDLSAIGEQDEQQIESQSEQPRSPGRPKGTGNKPRVDWRARKESIFSKMTALADSTAPPPALVRLLQNQLESCDAELSRQQDDHIAALKQGNKDLRDKLAERDALPIVPVLPANCVDMGSYIMVGPKEPPIAPSTPAVTPVEPTVVESVAVPSTEDIEKVKQAEVDKKALADKQKKEAEESAKKAAEATRKAANDKRIARIAELKQIRENIFKSRDNPAFMKELASNPAFGRAGNEGLAAIEAELRQLENPQPVKKGAPALDIAEEIKAENARTQRAYQAEWNWAMGGYQTSPPSGETGLPDGALAPRLFRRDE